MIFLSWVLARRQSTRVLGLKKSNHGSILSAGKSQVKALALLVYPYYIIFFNFLSAKWNWNILWTSYLVQNQLSTTSWNLDNYLFYLLLIRREFFRFIYLIWVYFLQILFALSKILKTGAYSVAFNRYILLWKSSDKFYYGWSFSGRALWDFSFY